VWIFGYGSLVNRASLGRALGRDVFDARPAWLAGWRREWTASSRVIAAGYDQGVLARFFDLRADPATRVNGIVVAVTDAELTALTVREQGYDRIDVSTAISGAPEGATVLTFVGRAPAPGAITLSAYLRLVEDGFAALGGTCLADFRATTPPAPPPIVDGAYRFADAAQNALTTWAHATK
jgi:hypothetical protein